MYGVQIATTFYDGRVHKKTTETIEKALQWLFVVWKDKQNEFNETVNQVVISSIVKIE